MRIIVEVKQGSTWWREEFDSFDVKKIYEEIETNPYNSDRNSFWVFDYDTTEAIANGWLVFDTKEARKMQKDGMGEVVYSKRDLLNLLKRKKIEIYGEA